MFHLEQSISEWRQQMLAAGIQTPVPLEELEIHLREEIERQMKTGTRPQPAFERAVQRIGQPKKLRSEFQRAIEPLEARLVKLMSIGCCAVAFFFALWALLVLMLSVADWTVKLAGWVGVATLVLAWWPNHRFLPVIRNQLARTALGFAGCVGSLLWIQYFISHCLPRLILERWGFPSGFLFAEYLWSWTFMAILGGIGLGLEKAARKKPLAGDWSAGQR